MKWPVLDCFGDSRDGGRDRKAALVLRTAQAYGSAGAAQGSDLSTRRNQKPLMATGVPSSMWFKNLKLPEDHTLET